jgi:hypothetical protein
MASCCPNHEEKQGNLERVSQRQGAVLSTATPDLSRATSWRGWVEMADLFHPNKLHSASSPTYDYQDAAGKLVYHAYVRTK